MIRTLLWVQGLMLTFLSSSHISQMTLSQCKQQLARLPTSEDARTSAVNQSTYSFLFKLPHEVRMEVYSYLFPKTILHVEAIHPFIINKLHIRVFPTPEHLSDADKKKPSHP